MAFTPKFPYNVPLILLACTKKEYVRGVLKKTYSTEGEVFFCSFRTFGGTERESNGVVRVENTAVIETWFRPDIKADCAVKTESGEIYEIEGTPEDIDQRHQFLVFKVKEMKGGA